MATVNLDYFSETASVASSHRLYSGWYQMAGQSFNTQPGTLTSVKFYLKRLLSSGSAYAKLYSKTGAHGSTAKPSATLATSAAVNILSINQTNYTLTEFTFATPYQLDWSQYVIGLDVTGAATSATAYVLIAKNKIPTPNAITLHEGNASLYQSGTGYINETAGQDIIFKLYGDDRDLQNSSRRGGSVVHQARPRSTADILRSASPMIKASAQAMRNAAMERERVQSRERVMNQQRIKKLKK